MSKRRVRLTADLTRYDSRLVAGSLGWTCPEAHAMWGVMVRYDNGAYLDTLWKSLNELEDETKQAEQQDTFQQFDFVVKDLLKLGVAPQELRTKITTLARTKNGASKRQKVRLVP
jgi:hypothetical protein